MCNRSTPRARKGCARSKARRRSRVRSPRWRAEATAWHDDSTRRGCGRVGAGLGGRGELLRCPVPVFFPGRTDQIRVVRFAQAAVVASERAEEIAFLDVEIVA